MATGKIGDLTGGLHRHRATSDDHVGGRAVGEGERGEGRVRVQRHRAGTARIEGGCVVHTERAVETRRASGCIPVGKVRPVAATRRPSRLARVDKSAYRQEVRSDLRDISGERGTVAVDHPDHIGKDADSLIGAECQDCVPG